MSERADIGAMKPGQAPVSLYVHVPFCVMKCAYCDFHSAPIPAEPGISEHFAWAVTEGAAHWAALGALDDVVSIYVGGGTPTTLGRSLVTLLDGVRDCARVRAGAEVTVESNPDTTDPVTAMHLAATGVTRFSLGVQSFDDDVLLTLGRCHDAARAERAARELAATGARLSLDLMCGVPGQTLSSWRETLERAIATGAGHVSVYPLALEEGTLLTKRVEARELVDPDPDLAAEMMELATELLATAGMARYEVASYAREGEQALHNTGYWTGRPYVGIGPSAASMVPAATFASAIACETWGDPGVAGVGRTVDEVPPTASRVRFTHSTDTVAFLRKPVGPPEEVEFLSVAEAAAEDAMLGLRLAEGITTVLAESAGASEALSTLAGQGLVECTEGRWRVTQTGWLLGNEVFAAVWNAGARRGLA